MESSSFETRCFATLLRMRICVAGTPNPAATRFASGRYNFCAFPEIKEGGAGRRGLAGPHGLVPKNKRHENCLPRGPVCRRRPARGVLGLIPAQAGFARFAHPEPRRSYQAFLLGEALLSAAGGIPHRMRRIWDTNAPDPETPVAPGRGAGHSRLQPPQSLRHSAATAPDPHSKTPLETPLVDRDGWNIVLYREDVKMHSCPSPEGRVAPRRARRRVGRTSRHSVSA
jgi:hypothetical protein